MKEFAIYAVWDEEASVWVAESEDIPGLATYGATTDELLAKLKVMVPELLEANSHLVGLDVPDPVPFSLIAVSSAPRCTAH